MGNPDATQRFGRVLHPVLGHGDEEALQGASRVEDRTVLVVRVLLNDRGRVVVISFYHRGVIVVS